LPQALDEDRARLAYAREIIAHEIDDHDVLGALLRAGQELGGQRRIGCRVRSTWPRALDRTRANSPSGRPEEGLGAGAEQRSASYPHEPAMMRRCRLAQTEVRLYRVVSARNAEPGGQAQLVRVTGA